MSPTLARCWGRWTLVRWPNVAPMVGRWLAQHWPIVGPTLACLWGRFISAPEAYWCLAEYKMHDKSHCIVRLALHLPNQQPVYFREGNHEAATESAAEKDTMLTAYFKYNAANHTQYTYSEFPKYFVFNKQKRVWTPRKQRGGFTQHLQKTWKNIVSVYCFIMFQELPPLKILGGLRAKSKKHTSSRSEEPHCQ